MPKTDSFVSVVARLGNDADIVDAFVDETMATLRNNYSNYELVLVDDGSTDDTVLRVDQLLGRHPCVRLLRLSRRFGVEAAISAGLDSVIGDYVVVMEPASDPPESIPPMVERARANVGVVFGVCHDRRGQSWFVRAGAATFYRYAPRLFGIEVVRDATLFRVVSRQALNAINRIRDPTRYFRLLSMIVGFRSEAHEYVPIRRRSRPRRKTFSEAVDLALGLVVTQSQAPLRLAAMLSVLATAGNFAWVGYALLVYWLKPGVAPGWTTQSLHSATMFAVLFFVLAILAEYLGRIIEQGRDRPLYHLLEERNSSVMIADETRRNVVDASPALQEKRTR